MLMKRSRSIQEDQNMAETNRNPFQSYSNNKHTNNSVFTSARLFLGQGPKALSDCDLVMSPTSPLDLMNLPSPFIARKSRDPSGKVSSRLAYSLNNGSPLVDEGSENQYKPASDGKSIVFGPQLRVEPSSIGFHFDDHPLISPSKLQPLGASIFEIADALEPECGREFRSCSLGAGELTDVSHLLASCHFLSFCYSCSKELAGEDIYIYRGEKAFCSPGCRETEMLDDKELEETDNSNTHRRGLDDKRLNRQQEPSV